MRNDVMHLSQYSCHANYLLNVNLYHDVYNISVHVY